ncbi:MAG: hypothetical protein QOH83_200 [Solirubrobacteraceae bacterium]|jgi:hypothetical protein|nr:hypothetical protein [Solirubrobacteraceae bacterium]
MFAIRSRRAAAALLTIGALSAGSAVATAPAQASLLGGLLPNLGTIITQTGATLGSLIPGLGGVVTGVTGAVGGVVGGVQTAVVGVVDQTLGGVLGGTGGLLPTGTVNTLLGTLLSNSAASPGTPGTGVPGVGGPIVLSGGQVSPGGMIVDASAPRSTVKVLSKLKQIGETGKLKIEISTNEPGVVAVAGTVHPGAAVAVKTKKGKKAAKHSRAAIKVPQIVLGYREAGKLVATVRLSRGAQRALGESRNAVMSVGTVAVDVFKNQDSESTRLNLTR